jgi:hypothetical protein
VSFTKAKAKTTRIKACLMTIEKSSNTRFESILGGEKLPFAVFLREAKAYLKKMTVTHRLPQKSNNHNLEKMREAMFRTMISPRGRR